MGNTLTEHLASKMEAVKKEQRQVLREMKAVSKMADRNHDRVAAAIEKLQEPKTEKDVERHEALMHAKQGLLAASEFGKQTARMLEGEPQPVNKHSVRDNGGKFTMKGSYGHFLGQFLKRKK